MNTDDPNNSASQGEMMLQRTDPDPRASAALEALRAQANSETVPSGILLELADVADALDRFDGGADAPTAKPLQWLAAWDQLAQSVVGESGSLDASNPRPVAESQQAEGALPVLIADLVYERARPRWEAHLRRAATSEADAAEAPELSTLVRRGSTLMASAIPRTEFDLFTAVAGKQYGLEATFVVPAGGYRTNTGRDLVAVSFDFGDGASHRTAVGEPVHHTFEDFGTQQVTLTLETSDGESRIARFEVEVAPKAPKPDAIWRHEQGALDQAYLYYGFEGGRLRSKLEKPVLLADGFPGGRNIDQLWPLVNQSDFVTKLRRRGHDVVIIGFNDGSFPIEFNAASYIRCVERAIREKANHHKIAAGGASMGGLIARYALCTMESESKDHQVGAFYTVDTPHYGANIPVSVQAFVQLYESHSNETKRQAALMVSPAARQMLLQWIPPYSEWRNGGRYPTAAPQRETFLTDLREKGWMPKDVTRKIGVADGLGNGTGNGVPAGAKAFWFECTIFAWANMWAAQASPAEVVSMNRGFAGWSWTHGAQRIDGAPGGTRGTWQEVYNGVGNVRRELWHPNHCFVPSTSACAIAGDLYQPLARGRSELDVFKASSTTNLEHVKLTPELCDFLVEEITRPVEGEADAASAASEVAAVA